MDLGHKKCIPCEVGGPPLPVQEAERLLAQIKNWTLWPGARAISKEYKFPNFTHAFDFVTKVAAIAEEEGHHPDISLSWGRVEIELSTHAVQGLSENDFIVAAKIDAVV